MSEEEGWRPGGSMRLRVMPCILCSTMRTFLVSALNASAAAVFSPNRELIVEDLPVPDLPRSRMVHVKPRSESAPSFFSFRSASATARSNEVVDPRPAGAAGCFLPLLSCSASSRR